MTILERFAIGPDGRHIVLLMVLQIAAAVVLARLIAWTFARRKASGRHAIWLGALTCVCLAPAVAIIAERSGYVLAVLPVDPAKEPIPEPSIDLAASVATVPQVSPQFQSVEPLDLSTQHISSIPSRSEPLPNETRFIEYAPDSEPERPRASWISTLSGAAVVIWGVGALIGLVRIELGRRRIEKLRRSSRPFDIEGHDELVEEVREALGIAEPPSISVSSLIEGPVAIGVLRPSVVLPRGLATSIDRRGLRDVLIHECAHAIRGDMRIGLLQRLVAVAYWPHPFVHYMNARLSRAREEVCDDHVLRRANASDYARTLLQLTVSANSAKSANFANGLSDPRWSLRDRVAGLLDPRRNTMTKSAPWTFVTVASLLIVSCAAIGRLRPASANASDFEPAAEITARLDRSDAPERIIRGVVVDEAGRPVEKAVVRPNLAHKAIEPATTASDGTFSLRLRGHMLLEETLIASARNDGLMGLGTHIETDSAERLAPTYIVLKPSRSTKASVRDANGQGVPGAGVWAIGAGYEGTATTDDQGDAVLRFPTDAKVKWIVGLKDRVGFDYYECYRSRFQGDPDPPPDTATLRLAEPNAIRVAVSDSAGKPVAGVPIRINRIERRAKLASIDLRQSTAPVAVSDATGAATFSWFPSDASRTIVDSANDGDHSRVEPLSHPAHGQIDETINILRGTTIGGVVRHADGRPAPSILLQVSGRGQSIMPFSGYARTAADGSYRLKVASDQSYMISVIDRGSASESLRGVIAREGRPLEGLDFTLVEGTLIRGKVTDGAGGLPVDKTITLIEEGGDLPPTMISRLGIKKEMLARIVRLGPDGSYQTRVGPGSYRFAITNTRQESFVIHNELTMVRDFRLETRQGVVRTLTGRIIEQTPAGERPIPGAEVTSQSFGGLDQEDRAFADESGRFRFADTTTGTRAVYVRNTEGTLAGLARAEADVNEIRVQASEAARIVGRMLDANGRALSKRSVRLELTTGVRFPETAVFRLDTRTDAEGRFEFRGMPVTGFARVYFPTDSGTQVAGSPGRIAEFEIRGPDPVRIPDYVVSAGDTRAAAAATPTERSKPAGDRGSSPRGPSRADVEALIRSLGRDPVTPESTDRAWLSMRQMVTSYHSVEYSKLLLKDVDFVQRVDEAAIALSGRPADATTLLRCAANYLVGFDDTMVKELVRDETKSIDRDVLETRGTVVDERSGRPIANALVHDYRTLTRTDATGAFTTRPRPGQAALVHVEAEGYATVKFLSVRKSRTSENVRIELVPESPISGMIVDAAGAPIEGASVIAYPSPRTVAAPKSYVDGINFSHDLVSVTTGVDGRFTIGGLPVGVEIEPYSVRHRTYRRTDGSPGRLTAGGINVIRMATGCRIAGKVIDQFGRPIAGADVQLRVPTSPGSRERTLTGSDGRFRFENAEPRLWKIVIQPPRHAPVTSEVLATESERVENQYIVELGGYVSGKVLGPDGKPSSGVTVGWVRQPVSDVNGPNLFDLSRATKTGADGTFRLGPIAPGVFKITAVTGDPRLIGHASVVANQSDAVIRLQPESFNR